MGSEQCSRFSSSSPQLFLEQNGTRRPSPELEMVTWKSPGHCCISVLWRKSREGMVGQVLLLEKSQDVLEFPALEREVLHPHS